MDLLLLAPELERAVLERALPTRILSRELRVASAEDVVLLKLMRLSDQDRADIGELARAQRLDRAYLERSAAALGLLDAWRELSAKSRSPAGRRRSRRPAR